MLYGSKDKSSCQRTGVGSVWGRVLRTDFYSLEKQQCTHLSIRLKQVSQRTVVLGLTKIILESAHPF